MDPEAEKVIATKASSLRRVALEEAPPEIRSEVARQEARFGTRFATVTEFPASLLDRLHSPVGEGAGKSLAQVTSCPEDDPRLHEAMSTLTRVANTSVKDIDGRREYLQALYTLFLTLSIDARALAADPSTLCVAPEREGRQLGAALGYLAEGRSLTPNAKRVPYSDGLLVALTSCEPQFDADTCLVVDGVLATGATVITTIDHLRDRIRRVCVVCAHSTPAAVHALQRYALEVGIELDLHVAVISGRLNAKYYAIDDRDPDALVLGDVGDTISDVNVLPGHRLSAAG